MIFRMWRGPAPKTRAEEYERRFETFDVGQFRKVPGNRGVYLLRRDIGDQYEYMAMSLWESLDAVKQFAGPEYMRALYYPTDHDIFTYRSPTSEHFDLVLSDTEQN